MFRNEIIFTQSHPLSKKERKEICASLELKLNKECVKFINANFKTMTIQKGNILNHKRNVIFHETNPILFEYDDKVYYPSVYLLEMCNGGLGQNILDKVALIYDATVEYIENGADLMLKGVLNMVELKQINFALNDLFYVQTNHGKTVAIGLTLVSQQIMNIDNPSGKFLKIIHKIGDSLWDLGTKKEQIPLPIFFPIDESKVIIRNVNANKQQSDIFLIGNNRHGNLLDQSQPGIISEITNQIDNQCIIEGAIEQQINSIEKDKEEWIMTNDKKDLEDNEEDEEEHIDNNNLIEEKESNSKTQILPTQEEVDENLDIVFLTLCKLHLQKEKYPIDPGKLLKDYMKPLANQLKLTIDLKSSSHKKINNYLKHLQKEKSLVTFSKAKGQTNDYLQSINWNSNIIKDFKPRIKKLQFLEEHAKEHHDNILLSKDEKIIVAELYRPNHKIKSIFSIYIPTFSEKEYYSLKECTEVLTKYLQSQGLFIITSPGMCRLNQKLEEMLSVHHKAFSINEREYKIEDVIEMWRQNLNQKSCILKTSTTNEDQIEEVFYPKGVSIHIVAKKIQNKNVTLIEGLEKFVDIKDVTKTLSKTFATSVTVKDIQGMKNAIFIQGYWVTELVNLFLEEFKLKKSLIKIEDRLKIKKK